MVFLHDGRRKNSTRLAFQVRKVGGHWQHQVVQKALDRVVVRLVPDPTWSEQHAVRLRQEVQEYFESAIQVDVEIHERLAAPPNGKFQNIVVEVT